MTNTIDANLLTTILQALTNTPPNPTADPLIGREVIIRSRDSGAWFGTLTTKTDNEVRINDAIRLWYWDGAFTLSALAVDGTSKPDACKFALAVPEVTVGGWCEIIPVSVDASKSIRGVKPHQP
jgi:hypothetical protein